METFRAAHTFTITSILTYSSFAILEIDAGLKPAKCCKSFFFIFLSIRNLKSRLYDFYNTEYRKNYDENRKSQIGTGDRSERIRTYNFPQGRVSDHRINLTLYRLTEIMNGDLDSLVVPVIEEHQADMLAQLASEN